MVFMILIPTVWFALAAFFVIVCVMAARSDAAIAAQALEPRVEARIPALARMHWHELPRSARSREVGVARSVRGRGVRGRAGRCVAGS